MSQRIGYNYLNSQVAELDKLEREGAGGGRLIFPLIKTFQDDFQSVLHTLKSLFIFFCFVSCKTSQNVNISQLLISWLQSFLSCLLSHIDETISLL